MVKNYLAVDEVAEALGVSIGKAYAVIRQLNAELKAKGYITISGRISRAYFTEKYYGYQMVAGD